MAAAVAITSYLGFSGAGINLIAPELSRRIPSREIVVPVSYRGKGVYRDDPSRLVLVDRLGVSSTSLRQTAEEMRFFPASAAASAPTGFLVGQLELAVSRELIAQGWQPLPPTVKGDVFKRKRRRVLLDAAILPTDTGNRIGLPKIEPGLGLAGTPLRMPLSQGSWLRLDAPAETLDSSFPENTRQSRPISGREILTIPLEGNKSVEIDVRSPWFRGGFLGTGLEWMASGFKYVISALVALIIAILSKPLRLRIEQLLRMRKPGQGGESA